MSRISTGHRFHIGVSFWGCVCMEHKHQMLQLGSLRFVIRYPKCVREKVN